MLNYILMLFFLHKALFMFSILKFDLIFIYLFIFYLIFFAALAGFGYLCYVCFKAWVVVASSSS